MRKPFRIFLFLMFWAAIALFGISRMKRQEPGKSFEGSHKVVRPSSAADTTQTAQPSEADSLTRDSAAAVPDTLASTNGTRSGEGGRR